jgi:hypothetical protein
MATPTTLPAAFVSGNVLTAAQLNDLRGAFRVLQVVSTTVTASTFSTTSATYTNITGLTVNITPSSTSSQVLVIATVNCDITNNNEIIQLRLARGGSAIGGGTDGTLFQDSPTNARPQNCTMVFLDSPASTSALTYSAQTAVPGSLWTFWLNRAAGAANYRGISTITVMEISA